MKKVEIMKQPASKDAKIIFAIQTLRTSSFKSSGIIIFFLSIKKYTLIHNNCQAKCGYCKYEQNLSQKNKEKYDFAGGYRRNFNAWNNIHRQYAESKRSINPNADINDVI